MLDNKKQWYFTASIDAINIDFDIIIYSNYEPGFWFCEDLARRHGCSYWTIDDLNPGVAR